MEQYRHLIKNIYYFSSLSDQDIDIILSVCNEVRFSKNEIIFKEGSLGRDFHIIIQGTVEIWKNYSNYDQSLISIQGAGNFFGEMSLIDSMPRSATVKASGDVVTLSVSQDDFTQIIKQNNSIALAIMKSMSSIIRNSTEKLFTNLNVKSKMLIQETEVRKLSETALRESEEKFRILAENVTDILWIVDNTDDTFTYISPAVERILGYRPSDLIKKSWKDIVLQPYSPYDSFSIFENVDLTENSSSKTLHTVEMVSIHSDGSQVWLESSFHFLKNNDGDTVNTLGVSRDITKRKQMEKKLADTQALFHAALDQSSAGVILSDSEGKYIKLANTVAENIIGLPKNELINSPINVLISDRITFADGTPYSNDSFPIVRAVKQGLTINEEVILKGPGNTIRWLLVNAAPIKNSVGDIIAGIAVFPDITKNKELENKTREFGIKFQQARKMESVATLAGGIAHEFNNALFEITGNIELLQMNIENQEALTNYSSKIKNSAMRMANLTKKLLAYSRGGKYQPVVTRFTEIVEQSIPARGTGIENVNICFEKLSDNDKIEADITQLKMAIKSIITNSLESIIDQGRIKIQTYTMIADDDFAQDHKGLIPGDYACVKIADNGKGMPVKTINKIFEPFFTTNFPGRGLGMAAVYGIVKNHGGWIGVDSTPGKGTSVVIYIPRIEDTPDQDYDAEQLQNQPKSHSKVLIIEDISAVLAVNREMFEYLGYNTQEAKSGKDGIKMIKNNHRRFDLVILDFDLPDMKCETVYSEIKKINPDINILISTGYPTNEISKALNIDRKHIIQKPYSLSTLSFKLKEHTAPVS